MIVRFNTVDIDGLKVFHRSAGDQSAPVVLLQGFPSASHMFRDLIPELAGKYHVVAPTATRASATSASDAKPADASAITPPQLKGTLP
jgi:pimeloyl-ACP methyl ester carboxylesterase